jgi:hypothetical protein
MVFRREARTTKMLVPCPKIRILAKWNTLTYQRQQRFERQRQRFKHTIQTARRATQDLGTLEIPNRAQGQNTTPGVDIESKTNRIDDRNGHCLDMAPIWHTTPYTAPI